MAARLVVELLLIDDPLPDQCRQDLWRLTDQQNRPAYIIAVRRNGQHNRLVIERSNSSVSLTN